MKRTIQEVSAETLAAEAALSGLEVGESMSYEVLAVTLGRDPMGAGRAALYSARKRLFRERQMVFACVPGEAVKRLGDVEMVSHGDNVMQRIRRASRRGMAVVLAVENFHAMPKDMQARHNLTALVLGSVTVLMSRPGQRRIAGKIAEARALTEQEVKAIAESI
jgi:hypothetical protein